MDVCLLRSQWVSIPLPRWVIHPLCCPLHPWIHSYTHNVAEARLIRLKLTLPLQNFLKSIHTSPGVALVYVACPWFLPDLPSKVAISYSGRHPLPPRSFSAVCEWGFFFLLMSLGVFFLNPKVCVSGNNHHKSTKLSAAAAPSAAQCRHALVSAVTVFSAPTYVYSKRKNICSLLY